MKWLLPAAAVAVLVFFGLQFLGKDQDPAIDSVSSVQPSATEATSATATGMATDAATEAAGEAASNASGLSAEVLQAAQASMPEGIDLAVLTSSLAGVFGSTSDALSSITDVESAKSALPGIEAASDKLSSLKGVITRLPDAANGPIASVVNSGMATLKPLIDKVTAIPGVAELVQPMIGPMLDNLQALVD